MAATNGAQLTQNSSQQGSTLATAFPQVNGYAQNLDLIQIVSKKGLSVLAAVDFAGTVLQAPGLTLTQVGVVGAVTTYTGTITGGAANGLAGKKVSVTGFVAAGNNGQFLILSSDATTFTVTTVNQSNETHAGKAMPYTRGTRVGRFASDFQASDSPTLAQLFANAFANPSLLDILQVVNLGGNVHYYLDYLGVAHGS